MLRLVCTEIRLSDIDDLDCRLFSLCLAERFIESDIFVDDASIFVDALDVA